MKPLECEIIVGSIPAGAISRKGGSIWGMSVQRYLMASPALYWDDHLFFKQEEELWQKSQTLNAKVYVSAGEKELEPFLQSVIRFRERFIAHNYKGFEFTFHILRERDHEDQYMEALFNGLEYLYGSNHPTRQ